MLSPPSERSETTENLIADPCLPCITWKFARKYLLKEFSKKLTNGSFKPDAFQSDEGSMWSKEGGKLWNNAQQLAKDNQAIGETYLSWLIYRSKLDLLTESRFLRLELQDGSDHIFRYVLGLGIPGVLLTAVYMTLNMRTWYRSRKQNRLRKQVRRQEDDEILRAARPGQRVRLLSDEENRQLTDARASLA